MRVLLITPGINKLYNDNAYSFIYMAQNGIKICAISNRLRKTKGQGVGEIYDCVDGIEIHRIFRDFNEQTMFFSKKMLEVLKIVSNFKPDIIFCSQQKNINFSIRLKRYLKIPLILLVEFAYDAKNPFRLIGKERLIKSTKVGAIIAKIYWKWLSKSSDAIITCNPNDSNHLEKLKKWNKNVFFVPWPSYPTYIPGGKEKRFKRGIFIGALDNHKNIPEFYDTMPKIFLNKIIEQFFIIGQGRHQNIVKSLKKRFPGKLIHLPQVTRNEALKLIAESYFAYVPAKYGAWGFIEDCWAMKTPLIVTTNHYRFNNEKDCIVCRKENIDQAIKALFDNRQLYRKIQNGGSERFYSEHHAYKIGEKYIYLLGYVLNRYKRIHGKNPGQRTIG